MTTDGQCPAGCGSSRTLGELLCPDCWTSLPAHRRRPVSDAWTKWCTDFGDRQVLAAYHRAVDDLVAVARLRVELGKTTPKARTSP